MNQIRALSGTFMGRKVQDPKKVIEELLAQDRKDNGLENIVEPGKTGVKTRPIRKRKPKSTIGIDQNGTFLFFKVPYQGRILATVERPMAFCSDGKEAKLREHLTYLRHHALLDYTIANMELEYQMMRIAFELRDHPKFGQLSVKYNLKMRPIYTAGVLTADSLTYSKKPNVHIVNFGKVTSGDISAHLPYLYNGKDIIHGVRAESSLLAKYALSTEVEEFLKLYLGFGSELAGSVFPYFVTRANHMLRSTYLDTPKHRPCTYPGGLHVTTAGELWINPTTTSAKALLVKVHE